MKLLLAEKDLAARKIASLLGKYTRESVNGINLYRLGDLVVMGLSGHIMDIDFPKHCRSWDYDLNKLIFEDPVPIIRNPKYFHALKQLAPKLSKVILATDYDREGELIALEASQILSRFNPNLDFSRIRFSAITPKDLEDALSNPSQLDLNLAKAAEARRIIDLIWGAVLTRWLSNYFNRRGENFLSAGRVQTPTLKLIVDREQLISKFRSVKYYHAYALHSGFKFYYPQRFPNQDQAAEFISNLPKLGILEKFEEKTKSVQPPIPLNTTELLKELANQFGLDPQHGMQIAERLYQSGYISYPRTENTVFPSTIDFRGILEKLSSDPGFGKYALNALESELKPSSGKKRSDAHPPIHPVDLAPRSKIGELEWKVYELIARRFIGCFLKPAKILIADLSLKIGGYCFEASGIKIQDPGWMECYHYGAIKPKPYPELSPGSKIQIQEFGVEQRQTKPPPRYTDGSIIKAMSKLGLGTQATRHEILAKLKQRGYIRKSKRALVPSQISFQVTQLLSRYAQPISQPQMTSELEKMMDKIASGEMDIEHVVNQSREMLARILNQLPKPKSEFPGFRSASELYMRSLKSNHGGGV